LVTVTAVGSQKHYQANPEASIFTELCSIAQKTVGLAEPLRQALSPLRGKIHAAFIYGSVAKRQDTAVSDVDLMVLSDELNYGDVFLVIDRVSTWLGRTVNPTILSRQEFEKRVKGPEAFLTRLLAQPKIWVIGAESDLAI
jgi:predicted nucleotidyltransferase